MGKAVLISVRPKWCELITSGKKTIEVRKTAPKLKTPFKCYIYCTKFRPGDPDSMINLKGRKSFFMPQSCTVIGEFTCRTIDEFDSAWSEYAYAVAPPGSVMPMHEETALRIMTEKGCLTDDDITEYFGDEDFKASFWHISDLKIYDVPRAISEFTGLKKTRFGYAPYVITRPPQSWCYVEQEGLMMENLYRKRTCSRCGTSTFEAVTEVNEEISAYRILDAFEFEPSGFMDVEVRCEGKTSVSFTLCQICQNRLDQMLEELKRGSL